MTADNLRTFPVASGQPQPASVPYSTFKHVCEERDRYRDECALLRPLLAPPPHVTPDEQERGEALIARALAMTYGRDTADVQSAEWGRAFSSPAIAALLVYPLGVVDTLAARRQEARPFWTPGRVALVAVVLALVAIVIVGR
jgi:hypothetical protein